MARMLTDNDDVLDYGTLDALRGDDAEYAGPLDHPCPLCGPERSTEYNQARPVLRTWRPGPGFITYNCARCGAKGYAEIDGATFEPPRAVAVPPPIKPRTDKADLGYVERLWAEATPSSPAINGYFRFRHIAVEHMPEGVFRLHMQCPWSSKKVPCILARYSDALTGERRGLWRRSADGLNKPMTLGPMAGCVIRLWPTIGKRLVVGEGVETVLAAATRITHRGKPLRPAWATGCAGNMRRLPVIDGVKQLIILVDNDLSGVGQAAAEECARRWCEAGREVTRLIPKKRGSDFNDLVRA